MAEGVFFVGRFARPGQRSQSDDGCDQVDQ
jgi:hypothetical protein